MPYCQVNQFDNYGLNKYDDIHIISLLKFLHNNNLILLGVEDERKMAFPDYAQTSADHRRGKVCDIIHDYV